MKINKCFFQSEKFINACMENDIATIRDTISKRADEFYEYIDGDSQAYLRYTLDIKDAITVDIQDILTMYYNYNKNFVIYEYIKQIGQEPYFANIVLCNKNFKFDQTCDLLQEIINKALIDIKQEPFNIREYLIYNQNKIKAIDSNIKWDLDVFDAYIIYLTKHIGLSYSRLKNINDELLSYLSNNDIRTETKINKSITNSLDIKTGDRLYYYLIALNITKYKASIADENLFGLSHNLFLYLQDDYTNSIKEAIETSFLRKIDILKKDTILPIEQINYYKRNRRIFTNI